MTEPESTELLELAAHVASFLHEYAEARRVNRWQQWQQADRHAKKLQEYIRPILAEEKKPF